MSHESGACVFGSDLVIAPGGTPDRVVGDCRALPFRDASVGSLVSVLMIEHVPGYEAFLDEAVRVLVPGGRLYLVFPNRYSLVTPVIWCKRVLRFSGGMTFHKPLSPRGVCKSLEGRGVRVESASFLSIGAYRGGIGRFASAVVRVLLPVWMREEVVLVCRKQSM